MNQAIIFDKQDQLKIMHLNIKSIKTATKQTQLKHLIKNHNPDIISLNETYLTKKSNLTIKGFNIIRADAAICIRSTLDFQEINLGKISGPDDAFGLTITSAIVIFSIYSPPKAPLNQTLFSKITKNHKDLNNNLITFLKGKKCTGPNSDLKITQSLQKLLRSLKRPDQRSTTNSGNSLQRTKKKMHFQNSDRNKYEEVLFKADHTTDINSTVELNLAAFELNKTIQNARNAATKSITIMTKPKSIQSIPQELLYK